jgi:uncharacterized protein (DUF1800 family)
MATSSLRPLPAAAFDYWKAHHLLSRAGFGATPAQTRALADMGLDRAVDHLVDYEAVDYEPVLADEFDPDIMRPPTPAEQAAAREARRSGDEAAVERFRRERQRRQAADRGQMVEIQRWWMKRLIETPRPLEEKMTLFWHGHFATGYRAIEDSYHMFRQNQFFRANATGSFADLVYGIIRDPAMLRYLNNDQNRRQRPNENLARELMELFVLGEGHLYGEDDIKEGARALSGYTFRDDEFLFRPELHDDGVKRILGRVGPWDGTDFCRIILEQKVASEFITYKLYRYFVNDGPGDPDKDGQSFVLKLARELRRNDYGLKETLRTLFRSEHFYAPEHVAGLIKSPVQLIVQALRSLRTPVRQMSALLSAANLCGQSLFNPPNVQGWLGGRGWINTATMFTRQNVLVYLLTGRRPEAYDWEADGEPFDGRHLLEHLRRDDGTVDVGEGVTYLLRFGIGREPHPQRVDELSDFVRARGGGFDRDTFVELLALITAMPEYQLC